MDREATFWKQRFNAVRQFFSRLGGVVEPHLPEPPPEDAQLYDGNLDGEVNLVLLPPPPDLDAPQNLYVQLETIPEVKILRVMSSYKGTTITLLLEKPLSAVDMLTGIPGLKKLTSIPGRKMYAVCKSGTFWLSK